MKPKPPSLKKQLQEWQEKCEKLDLMRISQGEAYRETMLERDNLRQEVKRLKEQSDEYLKAANLWKVAGMQNIAALGSTSYGAGSSVKVAAIPPAPKVNWRKISPIIIGLILGNLIYFLGSYFYFSSKTRKVEATYIPQNAHVFPTTLEGLERITGGVNVTKWTTPKWIHPLTQEQYDDRLNMVKHISYLIEHDRFVEADARCHQLVEIMEGGN